MSKERFNDCEHSGLKSCPSNDALRLLVENWFEDIPTALTKPFEEAQKICAECKSFKSKKTDKP